MADHTASMTPVPCCSICIANYNGVGLLEACIGSVLAQGWWDRAEIIVHDDASTDGSVAFLRTRYPTVQVLESQENVGFCIANNRMARMARGEFLLFLNNDAMLLPGALDALLAAARQLKRPAILSLPQYDAESGRLLDRGCLLDPFLNPVPNHDSTRREVGMVMGACMWLPKALWDELGGFPEWFGSIGEDLYLCCIARLRGASVHVPPVSGYRHHVGYSFGGGQIRAGRLRTTFRRRGLSERNKSFALVVCYPLPALCVLLPLHLVFLVAEGGLLALLKRDSRYWRSIYGPCLAQLWRNRSLLLQTRAEVQAQRRVGLREFFSTFVIWPRKLTLLLRHGLPIVS
ncbi:MAG: glycosyltransferase [Methylophilaceae bacterium]|nr:glycosyltransferase [Methylophilaceae bacterium]